MNIFHVHAENLSSNLSSEMGISGFSEKMASSPRRNFFHRSRSLMMLYIFEKYFARSLDSRCLFGEMIILVPPKIGSKFIEFWKNPESRFAQPQYKGSRKSLIPLASVLFACVVHEYRAFVRIRCIPVKKAPLLHTTIYLGGFLSRFSAEGGKFWGFYSENDYFLKEIVLERLERQKIPACGGPKA